MSSEVITISDKLSDRNDGLVCFMTKGLYVIEIPHGSKLKKL